ncbi:MAG: tyrosine-type recombinase/integrase [Vicinamibacterales bacterium]
MPRLTLTDRTIAGLKPTPGVQRDYFDRALPGFGVRVSQNGRKAFVLMYRVSGKFKRMTLGVFPDVKLAKAREDARAQLRKATVGRDPSVERREALAHTFGALAKTYLEEHARRKKRSWRDDARMIRKELAAWDDRPVAALRRADVRALLEGIVNRGAPVLANRVLALIRKVLNFALDREWVESNVAAKMARPASEQSRARVLTRDEIKAVWKFLCEPAAKDLSATAARQWTLSRAALKLRLLTAQRGKEVLSMRWADVDGAWWTIPAGVSKNKQAHRVYLSDAARLVLDDVRATSKAEDFVFTGVRGTRQRRGALVGVGVEDIRPHDFRRTAASLMAGAGIPRLVVSKILNHIETGVTAIYDRHGYDSEKEAALTWWSEHLMAIVEDSHVDNVRPFAKRA